jgi:hypothetical protein
MWLGMFNQVIALQYIGMMAGAAFIFRHDEQSTTTTNQR